MRNPNQICHSSLRYWNVLDIRTTPQVSVLLSTLCLGYRHVTWTHSALQIPCESVMTIDRKHKSNFNLHLLMSLKYYFPNFREAEYTGEHQFLKYRVTATNGRGISGSSGRTFWERLWTIWERINGIRLSCRVGEIWLVRTSTTPAYSVLCIC